VSAFRLQRVLDLRKRREDEALARLATASSARSTCEKALDALIADERTQHETLSRRLSGGSIDPGEIGEFGRVLDVYARAVAAKRLELQRRIEDEDAARAALTSATIDRKALDKAKERHTERETVAQNRKESGFLEEIAAARAARLRTIGRPALAGGKL
jgi:flagellar export protein FliJ